MRKQENDREKQKLMAKYFGAKPGGDTRFSQQEAKAKAAQAIKAKQPAKPPRLQAELPAVPIDHAWGS